LAKTTGCKRLPTPAATGYRSTPPHREAQLTFRSYGKSSHVPTDPIFYYVIGGLILLWLFQNYRKQPEPQQPPQQQPQPPQPFTIWTALGRLVFWFIAGIVLLVVVLAFAGSWK